MPLPWLFPQFVVAPDGSLLAVNYTLRRIADGRFQEKCPVTILRSTDAGRTWDLWSEILYTPDPTADAKAAAREGFTEPYLSFMPDALPCACCAPPTAKAWGHCAWTCSTDNGRTWTKPALNLVAKPQWPDNIPLDRLDRCAIAGVHWPRLCAQGVLLRWRDPGANAAGGRRGAVS